MIISMMQPYFFPYLGYFQLIAQSDVFVFRDDVQYIKAGWINRNRILDASGREAWITLPVTAASHRLTIGERAYQLGVEHRRRILRQVEGAYFGSPNFRDALPLVHEVMQFGDANVATFNINLLEAVTRRLGLHVRFARASDLPNPRQLAGQSRVIDICARFGATNYVNPVRGRSLYEAQAFEDCGVELGFLKTALDARPGVYPYLSVIHTLMTEGNAAIREQLASHQVVSARELEGAGANRSNR
jgi:hypothetical protein